ncbi:CinA family protein [Novosphingobium sp.]|uniref:CinA family protein n=1 Tax=Novosphingobium sp. TaxID=1874826 RepID=UPI0038BCE232
MAVSTNDLPDEVQELEGFAKKVLGCLVSSGGIIATAESCTGGLLASLLTDLEGFGSVFDRGFVTYAEKAKVEMLGVPATMIAQRGVVSSAVARAMAEGALHRSSATIAIGITGFAGPAGPRDEEGLYISQRSTGSRWSSCANVTSAGRVATGSGCAPPVLRWK